MTKLISVPIFLLVLFAIELPAQISINEIMASNSNTIADEAGAFEDWIEVYNAGNQAVDLAGYYISDDSLDPLKWQIPAADPTKTTVDAGGFILLWADNDPEEGAHHLDFKLSAAGEEISLTAPEGITLIDQVSFSNQTQDISYGRSQDGGPDFQLFSSPTPGASNNGGSGVLTFPVSLVSMPLSAEDDAEEAMDGTVSLLDGLRMGEGFNGPTKVGIRFKVDLPADAIVDNAYIRFTALGVDINLADFDIKTELSANAEVMTATNANISSRPTSNSTVDWLVPDWDIFGGSDNKHETTNLAPVMQEVLAINGWQSGNHMLFIIEGTGTRNAFSFDQNPDLGPMLFIEASIPYPSDPISNVFINEIAAAGTSHTDEDNEKEDWIELYNANNFDIDLSGLYLTDNYNDLDKWKIPNGVKVSANGFITFFADNEPGETDSVHTNFSLRSKGEEVALAMQLATELVIVDSVSFDDAPFMSTYGRVNDGANQWKLFGQATPDASNNGALGYLAPPQFTLESGIYQGDQSTVLTHPEPGVTFIYTIDGVEPGINGQVYMGPIPITETTNLRAIAIKNGFAPSVDATAAYVLNKTPNLPIVYLTTHPDNFFDDSIGIYVDGTNGIQLYCAPYPVNWAQDWERPVNVKMFLPDGSEVFDVNAGSKNFRSLF